MAVEKPRCCGYRKVGALYLCGEGVPVHCDRIPYKLELCPVCGSGVKMSRGFQWLDWSKYAGEHGNIKDEGECTCSTSPWSYCPVCSPAEFPQPYCLLWVGEHYYSVDEFISEARYMGISKRIAQVPRNMKLGITWTLLAHSYACGSKQELQDNGMMKTVGIPGVFYVFKPNRLEMLLWKSDATVEKLEDYKRRSITPVIIPDDDKDHDPDTPLIPSESVQSIAKTKAYFEGLRSKLGG